MTIKEIETLIHFDETRTLELKKTTGELKDGMRSACAFLNIVGGWWVSDGLSLDDLMKPHSSHAQNPLIAQVMYYGKYLETWGRGIELMQEQCEFANTPAPQFSVEGGCFCVTFMRPIYDGKKGVSQDVPQGGTQGGTQDGTQDGTQEKSQSDNELDVWIVEQIKKNPKITTEELAVKSQKGVRTIKRHISMIGNVRFIGSGYSGHWEIVENDN
jgi:ATP-dependent DNA helicase RecG